MILVLLDNLQEILILTLRNFIELPVLRYLGVCNVLHIMGVSGPSLLIESIDYDSTALLVQCAMA